MKTKSILRAFLTAVFLLGILAINAQVKVYVYKSNGAAVEYDVSEIDSISFTEPATVDYSKLVLNEVSGNNKFVEIYNAGLKSIPMAGVKLQRNGGASAGGSEWVGMVDDVIPAGEYRLFLFNSYTPTSLAQNPAYVGWTVASGISSGQILKVAIVDPQGIEVSVFIRGDVPLPAWQSTTGVTQNSSNTYSRMSDGTWAYAAPTPGVENGDKTAEIVNPGYLTAQPPAQP